MVHYANFLAFPLKHIKQNIEIRENYEIINGVYLQNYAYVSC